MSLFDSGIRPAIDAYLEEKAKEQRNYGDYWSASSAGYCMRKLIFERLGVPPVKKESDARKQRVFEAGHIFHEWAQRITKNAGLSIAQELELQDEDFMIRGHIDDLVLIETTMEVQGMPNAVTSATTKKLILYDYKTQHANAFTWQKGRPPSYYHRMQAGTYMYMLRKQSGEAAIAKARQTGKQGADALQNLQISQLSEARILKISKDDLRMDENQILWTTELENDVIFYWGALNGFWAERKLPKCTCAEREGGFMAGEKYNPFYYEGEPCSGAWLKKWKEENEKSETVGN